MLARSLLVLALTSAAGAAHAATFAECTAGLKATAIQAGVSQAVAARALDNVAYDERALRLAASQAEFTTPIWDYFAFLVDNPRVADGRAKLRDNARLLQSVEQTFGVDRHVVAAIWGIESDYGRLLGDHYIPHALATLACEGSRRRAFWRGELVQLLLLVDGGDLALDRLYGSWAGAVGQTQFIPSTYRRSALDFDRDGRRDLIGSAADALGSTANYLDRSNWQSGQPWMLEATVPADYDGATGRGNRASLDTWGERGVLGPDGKPVSGDLRAALLLPTGSAGPAFLVFRNFDAIYAYNQSESYALAVSHLANRLAGGAALATAWPTDDPGLTRAQRIHLQQLLIAQGYLAGVADGRFGPLTTAAIAAAQRRLSMPETGRAGLRLYRARGL